MPAKQMSCSCNWSGSRKFSDEPHSWSVIGLCVTPFSLSRAWNSTMASRSGMTNPTWSRPVRKMLPRPSMLLRSTLTFVLLGALAACSSDPSPASTTPPGAGPPVAAPSSEASPDFGPLADVIERERLRVEAAGAVVVVQQHGKTVFSRSFGDESLTEKTLFRVNSIAKVWTAAAAMKLVEEG